MILIITIAERVAEKRFGVMGYIALNVKKSNGTVLFRDDMIGILSHRIPPSPESLTVRGK
jgi:hypothetical protein